jgi:hypothetical protein
VLDKAVYVLVFEEGTHFNERIQKICDSFNGKRYGLPSRGHSDRNAFSRKIEKIKKSI